MQTSEAVQWFLKAKEVKGLSGTTLYTYRSRLHIFATCCPELPSTPEDLETFLLRTGPTPETRDSYYRLLRTLYRWLERRKHISANPLALVEPIKLRRKVARALTREELAQLLLTDHPSAQRAFLYLLADTGLRLSEALSVSSPEHIKEDVVVVDGKTGERLVPISQEVARMVVAALPWPWANGDVAGTQVTRAFKRAGFSGKRASAQTLRHTFVRLWEGDETLLVGIMGWTSNRMLAVYRPYNVKRAVEQHAKYRPTAGLLDKRTGMSRLL